MKTRLRELKEDQFFLIHVVCVFASNTHTSQTDPTWTVMCAGCDREPVVSCRDWGGWIYWVHWLQRTPPDLRLTHSVADSFYVRAAILLPHDSRAQSNYCQNDSLQVHMDKTYFFKKLCSGFRLDGVLCVGFLAKNIWTVSFLCPFFTAAASPEEFFFFFLLSPFTSMHSHQRGYSHSYAALCFYFRLH